MKYCTKCGSENPDEGNFCQKCGNPFNSQYSPEISQPNITKKENNQKVSKWNTCSGVFLALIILLVLVRLTMTGIEENSPEYKTKVAETENFLAPSKTAAEKTKEVISIEKTKERKILLATDSARKTFTFETQEVKSATKNAENTSVAETKVIQIQTENAAKTIAAAQTLTATFLPSSTPTITPTATITPLPWQATGTANAVLAEFKSQYQEIYWKELNSYPDKYEYSAVRITGRASTINSSTEMNAFYGGTYEMFYVISKEPFSGIYEGNSFTVYGTVRGKQCGQNAMGGTVCLMVIDADLIEKN